MLIIDAEAIHTSTAGADQTCPAGGRRVGDNRVGGVATAGDRILLLPSGATLPPLRLVIVQDAYRGYSAYLST